MIRHPPVPVTDPQHPPHRPEHHPVQHYPHHHHHQGHWDRQQQVVELSIVLPPLIVVPGNVGRQPDICAPDLVRYAGEYSLHSNSLLPPYLCSTQTVVVR